MARTDSEKTPAMRLNAIRREWGLSAVDEATAQAQSKALAPLAKWLREGEDSPEVVIRAVQLLLADPELSGVDKRPAVETVIHQVSNLWANAGVEAQGMFGLQAMLLAAWPYDLNRGGFALAPLFDSAWEVMRGRTRQRAQINTWRQQVQVEDDGREDTSEIELDVPSLTPQAEPLTLPDLRPNFENLNKLRMAGQSVGTQVAEIISIVEGHKNGLTILARRLEPTLEVIPEAITNLVNQIEPALNGLLSQSRATQDFLWWGQSRYSQATRRPYRRIEDATERLWWMAWEASELALDLPADPAASFLVETLYQLEGKVDDQKRPLKVWLGELIPVLRNLHQTGQRTDTLAMSETLEELATEDALGLPVTWARLEAMNPKGQDSDIGERARKALAIDVDAPISRGDWAAWLFREALLDRRLHDEEHEED
ncbi:GTPase-associated system all-helical protein GASH [Archangium sp.]|uniref:GTPase-associated system all-helical protein GASH n=1 Tax=Archangium sp. TaxID=1872627 RepID=UPI002D32541A|nr:GTPase-associated system all-helical protein GASH [Archangium sp.]HYO52421.1 GTPase-associated system all-helical protein GASH [Archangium sp.]